MVENFDAKLNEYAHLLVEVGLNVQPGQTPRINTSLDAAPLARLCAAACYDRGARDVVVDWRDDSVSRQRYLRADGAVFSEFPSYQKAKFDWLLEHGSPNLSLTGSDPELLRGVDPARIQAANLAAGEPTKPFYDAMTAGKFQWCVGAFPTLAWGEERRGRPERFVGRRIPCVPHHRGRQGGGALAGARRRHRPAGQGAQ